MLIILCIISLLLFAVGTTLLIFSLGYPVWYKQVWKDHIESPVPDNLINLTTLIGSIILSIGFILMLIYIIKSDTPDEKYKRKKRKSNVVVLEKKLHRGPNGGRYYITRKCHKGKCHNLKNYV